MIWGMRVVATVFVVYCVAVTYLYLAQRSIMYVPDSAMESPEAAGLPEMDVIRFKTRDGLLLESWHAPARGDKPTIVFFHGNAGSIADRHDKAKAFLSDGYGLLLIEYRGYSGNPGQPSEENFYADGRAAVGWLRDKGVESGDIVFYGESLGSGPATKMAVEYDACALILDAPFTSAVAMAKDQYPWVPVDWLLKDRYDNYDRIPDVKVPVLILHGTDDPTVPIEHGRTLAWRAGKRAEFVPVSGGVHMDLFHHGAYKDIHKFLQKQSLSC